MNAERRQPGAAFPERDYAKLRDIMVSDHIAARGVRVPREVFLPSHLREFAYEDTPLPIGGGQTISQPYIVAFMVEAMAQLPQASVQHERNVFPASVFVKRYVSRAPAGQT